MNKTHPVNRSNSSPLILVLAGLTGLAGLFVVVTIWKLSTNADDERAWIGLASNVQVESQRLAKSAVEAARGNLEALASLETTHREVNNTVQALQAGDLSQGIPKLAGDVSTEMSRLQETWRAVNTNAQTIFSSEALVTELAESGQTFLGSVYDMQQAADQALLRLVDGGAPIRQVFLASRMVTIAERMHRSVHELMNINDDVDAITQRLSMLRQNFEIAESALRSGNDRLGVAAVTNSQARASLLQVTRLFETLKPQLDIILESSQNLNEVRLAADAIFRDSDTLFNRSQDLIAVVSALPRSRLWPSINASIVGLVLLVLSSAFMIFLVVKSARLRADTAFQSDRRTKTAIAKLLNELRNLADGDLTTHATVSDDITGAIAEAFNFAIDQLRELVIDINDTATAVANSADQTRVKTAKLATSASAQAGDVAKTAEQIEAMSSAFDAMAGRSQESSETALASVDIAKDGALKVRDTIAGMDTIRNQIQVSSKRIKRLGESTQEIGEIVNLINDIAEQTNVLALNAAIQAATAGGGGEGFAVVADEVQQLAESASQATKRITTLVQTIQLDTVEAAKSMEVTTQEVVTGAKLAHDAGVALIKGERTSTELSNLVQEIAGEARTYSDEAALISRHMKRIRDVSIQSSAGTRDTAQAVAELAELVMHLKESVADFKLKGVQELDSPDDGTEPVTESPDRPGQDGQNELPEFVPSHDPAEQSLSAVDPLGLDDDPDDEDEDEDSLPLSGMARQQNPREAH